MRRKKMEIFSSPVNRWNVIFSGSFNPNRNCLIGIVYRARVRGFLVAEYSPVLGIILMLEQDYQTPDRVPWAPDSAGAERLIGIKHAVIPEIVAWHRAPEFPIPTRLVT